MTEANNKEDKLQKVRNLKEMDVYNLRKIYGEDGAIHIIHMAGAIEYFLVPPDALNYAEVVSIIK